jgi:hypothetical protein
MYHTTTDSSAPTVVLFTILVIACAREGVLCRLQFTGNAASVAKLRYKEQVSVGDGCRLARAVKYTYKIKTVKMKILKMYVTFHLLIKMQ